jgi:hypothetical protein
MARKHTCGFGMGYIGAELSLTGSNPPSFLAGTPVYEAAIVRPGELHSLRLQSAQQVRFPNTGGDGVGTWTRIYVYFAAFPNSATDRQVISRPSGYDVRINNTGTLALTFGGTVIGSRSAALSLNTWYRIDFYQKMSVAGNDEAEARVTADAVNAATSVIATDSGTNRGATASTNSDIGTPTAAVGIDMYIAGVAINDDTGGSENSWVTPGRVVYLLSASDNARVGFTGGGGATTKLYDAVNNVPPAGAASTGTDASQIGSANANTTDHYDPNLAAYTDALGSGGGGMGVNDKVTLVQPYLRVGSSSASGRSCGIQSLSNPVVAEVTKSSPLQIAAAEFSTTWNTGVGAYTYAPSVTLGTGPVLKVRKATSTVDNVMVDAVGMLVEYVPATLLPLSTAAGTSSATLGLSAPTQLPLDASAGSSSATATITIPAAVAPGSVGGVGTASLAITAPTQLPLAAVAGTSTATLAISAQTQLPLAPTVGTSMASLGLSAPTLIAPSTAAGTSSAALALNAPTLITPDPAAGTSSASLGLTAATQISPNPAVGSSGIILSLTAATDLGGLSTSGSAGANLSLTAQTQLPLGPTSGSGGAGAVLFAPTRLPLDPTGGSSTASLGISAAASIGIQADGSSSTALSLSTPPLLAPLTGGSASAALSLTTPVTIAPAGAGGVSGAFMALTAPAQLVLAITGTATAALTLFAPRVVPVARVFETPLMEGETRGRITRDETGEMAVEGAGGLRGPLRSEP